LKPLTHRLLTLIAFTTTVGAQAQTHAADRYYLGLSLATPGEARRQVGPNASIDNENNPTALKLYAGMRFTKDWSAELGYGAFGSWRFSDPAAGSRDKAKIASQAFTVAARYSWDLDETLALFGKLGLALNRFRYSDTWSQRASDRFTRPLWGAGVEWKITECLSLPLEFEYLGEARTQLGKFRQEKLEVGLRYRF